MVQYRESENISQCNPYDVPSVDVYFTALNRYVTPLVCVGSAALLIVVVIFLDTLRHVVRDSASRVKARTVFIITIYPVVSFLSYLALLVPRAQTLSDALTQGMFMFALYQLFSLFLNYAGGQTELISKLTHHKLSLRAGPCCCWPCFSLIPPLIVTKKTLSCLKLLILQLPVIQGLIYVILLVIWCENKDVYYRIYIYFQPISIISILFGIWSMVMSINLMREVLDEDFLLQGKFLSLQMVLVFSRLQSFIMALLVSNGVFPCDVPITSQVYANMVHNGLILLEMVLLAALARKFYKTHIPGLTKHKPIISVIKIITSKTLKSKGSQQGGEYDNPACTVSN